MPISTQRDLMCSYIYIYIYIYIINIYNIYIYIYIKTHFLKKAAFGEY